MSRQIDGTLDALLRELDRDRLQSLLVRLVERDPGLLDAIMSELSGGHGDTADGGSTKPVAPDPNAVRRQMIASLRHPPTYADRGWRIFHMGPESSQLLQQIWALIHAGEGRQAMEMLNAMTDECLENWQAIMEDEEGETLSYVQDELGPAWVEAILSAELTPSERDGWTAKLDAWATELADYVGSASFDAALLALQQGWTDATLQRMLRGEAVEPESGRPTNYDTASIRYLLTRARLNVLDREGRHDEYLNLARAEGQVARYTTLLVRGGWAAEAIEYGLAHLETAEDALTLAQALREAGDTGGAMRIAERGLALEGRKVDLGAWLADLAAETGNEELAVHAATSAFQQDTSLLSYLRVQGVAGESWSKLREELLERLRRTRDFYVGGPVDIFLHEGLIDDAIALLDRSSSPSRHLIRQVADAGLETRPVWVIGASRTQAEAIMDAAKAEHYREAADWLTTAKRASQVAGREREWEEYLADLLARHHRKYKLVPLLEGLV